VVNRPPTHDLCVAPKDKSAGFQVVGVGWENEDGAISLRLNRSVILSWRDNEDLALYVFKRKQESRRDDGKNHRRDDGHHDP
jgi:hypothetical protein